MADTKLQKKSNLAKLKEQYKQQSYKDTGLVKYGPKKFNSSNIVTEERLMRILPELEEYYALWLAYPDKLVELLLPIDTGFKLLPFQIVNLRAMLRYRVMFLVATRGYSKSFIAILGKWLKTILLPGTKETIIAEHKSQATRIGREKINELKQLMPLLSNEINTKKGSQTTFADDYIRAVMKNKSELDITGLAESSRGGRRHGILFEEIKDLPAKPVNEVALPLLNISRRTRTGELNPNEVHQQQT